MHCNFKINQVFSICDVWFKVHTVVSQFLTFSAIPYTIRVTTGTGEDNGTSSNVWIKVVGPKKKDTGQLFLELAQKDHFAPGSTEIFSIEAVDVGEVKKLEVVTYNYLFLFILFYFAWIFLGHLNHEIQYSVNFYVRTCIMYSTLKRKPKHLRSMEYAQFYVNEIKWIPNIFFFLS